MMDGNPLLLALAPLAPLLLALMTALATGRGLALARALVPWAALPALAVGLMGDTQLRLDTALMGAMLALDATGRVFLLPMSVLWLTTALLMRPRLQARDAGDLAILMLLAMAGTFAMAVAGDGLLFYTAAAIAGYALYGVLAITADTGGCRAARVLVIFLIAGDLMVFEVLMTLALDATAADFRDPAPGPVAHRSPRPHPDPADGRFRRQARAPGAALLAPSGHGERRARPRPRRAGLHPRRRPAGRPAAVAAGGSDGPGGRRGAAMDGLGHSGLCPGERVCCRPTAVGYWPTRPSPSAACGSRC
ncbi:MAG: hypothetical protein U5S82_14675 [Gammaproteobacteria bacterium]|nr:hypothetical protein [Gammaproteobacteria bacterium]